MRESLVLLNVCSSLFLPFSLSPTDLLAPLSILILLSLSLSLCCPVQILLLILLLTDSTSLHFSLWLLLFSLCHSLHVGCVVIATANLAPLRKNETCTESVKSTLLLPLSLSFSLSLSLPPLCDLRCALCALLY